MNEGKTLQSQVSIVFLAAIETGPEFAVLLVREKEVSRFSAKDHRTT